MATQKKLPELRKVYAPKGAGLADRIAIELTQRFGDRAWFVRNRKDLVRFVEPSSFDFSRTDMAFIGFGGGRFDASKTEGKSSADLVAEFVGASRRNDIHELLKATRACDAATKGLTLVAPKNTPIVLPTGNTEEVRELRVIVTHRLPHADEYAALALALMYGNGRAWRWSQEPTVLFVANEEEAVAQYGGRSDVLFIGIAGDEKDLTAEVIDEHRQSGRLVRTCAAKLMAERLGIDKEPSLKWLLAKLIAMDTEASEGPLSLGTLFKVIHTYGQAEGEDMVRWMHLMKATVAAFQQCGETFSPTQPLDFDLVLRVLVKYGGLSDVAAQALVEIVFDAYQARGIEFNETCPADFKTDGRVEKIGDIRVAVVTSDCYGMNAWARTMRQAGVVVQKFSSGHIRVYSRACVREQMKIVAQQVLAAELAARGVTGRKAELAVEQVGRFAKPKDMPNDVPWYFHTGSQNGGASLLNGSESHLREPTKLSLDQVVEAVKTGLTQSATTTETAVTA